MTVPKLFRLCALFLLLTTGKVFSQTVPCPGGIVTNCPSPTYLNLTVGGTAALPGGYVRLDSLLSTLGPLTGGPILGVWPNLYFAASPSFIGTPVITGGINAQLEFVRPEQAGLGYTFVGVTPSGIGISSAENLPIVFASNGFGTKLFIDPMFGNVGIGTSSPTTKLDIVAQAIRIEQAFTPSSSSQTCAIGTITWDTGFVYICVATNTWKRSAIATW